MRWVAIALAAVLVMAAGMGDAQTPSSASPVKLALVIGNADYDGGGIDVTPGGVAQSTAGGYVPDLRNPINDATDIRDALTRIGFKVDFVTDADGPTMSAALATFGTKVAEAPDTAQVVIYYAGHAMQVDGVNYLIPARARLPQVDFSRMPSRQGYSVIESVTVPIQRVVDQFREPRAPGVNLLILDACRDNPWDSRVRGLTRNTSPNAGGLAQVAAPTRTIVSFSTALNRKAQDGGENDRNSPFAAALRDAIGKPGTITEMLDGVGTAVEVATFGRQSPWYQSASVGQVCLIRCSAAAQADRASLPPPPAPKTRPGDMFKECDVCPEMVVLPAGSFVMGSPDGEVGRNSDEGPPRRVSIGRPFAVAVFETTFAQWDACAQAGGCARPEEGPHKPLDSGWGRGNRPVIQVSWQDAKRYVRWLNEQVGGSAYRLLTEAEWEYAARAGSNSPFSSGTAISPTQAHYRHSQSYAGSPVLSANPNKTAPVGSFPANAFRVHDMEGNVSEWVEDCYDNSYDNAPVDGSAFISQACMLRVFRGGSWGSPPLHLRSALRGSTVPSIGSQFVGFRVARTL